MDSQVSFDEDEVSHHEATEPQANTEDFFSSGAPCCRFNTVGDSHAGVITKMEQTQQRDMKDGTPLFWPDGNKKVTLVITLATAERDNEIDDDDGTRRLYVKKPSGMFAAIGAAIRKANARNILVGGQLAVKYTGNGEVRTRGHNPPKEYAAKYAPPASNGHAAPAAPSRPIPTAASPIKPRFDAATAGEKALPEYPCPITIGLSGDGDPLIVKREPQKINPAGKTLYVVTCTDNTKYGLWVGDSPEDSGMVADLKALARLGDTINVTCNDVDGKPYIVRLVTASNDAW